MNDIPRVRTRYAPSPTGRQHIGGVRSALFPWLWARHNKGDFILRVEDTDQSRFRADALQDLFETLSWLGIDFDEGPDAPDAPPNEYFQTQRKPRYGEVARQLVEAGAAYYCYCSEERLAALREAQKAKGHPTGYDRRCRDLSGAALEEAKQGCASEGRTPVIRFRVPTGKTTVHDAIRDEWTADNSGLEDMILLKSDGLPTYHLGHLADDRDMGITHVMRGQEYIPTAPLHVLIHQALGWTPPTYVHLPLILDPGGHGKMSKRKQNPDGSISEYMTMVHEFREAGYLPEAIRNYIALLGWSVAPDRDIATVEEMIEKFDIQDIKKSPAAFNYEKLDFMNGYYIRHLPVEELAARVAPFLEAAGLPSERARLLEVLPLVQERMKLLSEAPELLDFFLSDAPLPKSEDLLGKKGDIQTSIEILGEASEALQGCEWTLEGIEQALRDKAKALNVKAGELFQPIRVAVTGRTQAPGIFETLYHVGREPSLERLRRALATISPTDSQAV